MKNPWPRRAQLAAAVLLLWMDASAAVKFRSRRPEPRGDDPYEVLGVRRTATDEVIQKAYRKKAKETHPDKNPSPSANEEFRRVTEAFEILGDPVSRRKHDAKIRQEEQRRRRARDQERRREEMRREQSERQRREVLARRREMAEKARRAREGMMKLSSLEQFEERMLDRSRRVYATNCLVIFVSNKNAERRGDDEILFPYPFDGDSTLRTAKVRFNSQTELTRLFRARSNRNDPHIIFAQKGDAMENFEIFYPTRMQSADKHGDFKKWVTSLLVIGATVSNKHSLPVEFLILRDGRIIYTEDLDPGYEVSLNLHAGDRIVAFDKRVDSFPGAPRGSSDRFAKAEGTHLLDAVVAPSRDFYAVPPSRCYDLSTGCRDYASPSRGGVDRKCREVPEFMHGVCPRTCGACGSRLSYLVFHCPIHRFPPSLRGGVWAFRRLMDDIDSVLRQRRNVAAGFFGLGLLVAFNFAFFSAPKPPNRLAVPRGSMGSRPILGTVTDVVLLLVAGAAYAWTKRMLFVPVKVVPMWLRSLRGDLARIAMNPIICKVLLIAGVVTGVYFDSLASCVNDGSMDADRGMLYVATLLMMLCAAASVALIMMNSTMMQAHQWEYLWKYSKNAAFVFYLDGALAGLGFLSLMRLMERLQKTSLILPVVSNLSILAVAVGLMSMDPHFEKDLMHVMKLRKNAALLLFWFGILVGWVFVNIVGGQGTKTIESKSPPCKVIRQKVKET